MQECYRRSECDDFESAAQLDPDCLEAVSGILATSPRVDSPGNAVPPADVHQTDGTQNCRHLASRWHNVILVYYQNQSSGKTSL